MSGHDTIGTTFIIATNFVRTGEQPNAMRFKKYSYHRFAIVSLCLMIVGCGSKNSPKASRAEANGKNNTGSIVPTSAPDQSGKAVLDELGVSELTPKRRISENKPSTADDGATNSGSNDDASFQSPSRWINADELPYEFWEVQYLGNRPVGYLFQKVTRSPVGFRIESKSSVRITRDKQRLAQGLVVTSIEEIDGRIKTVESLLTQGTVETKTDAYLIQGALRLKKLANGTATDSEIPWKNVYGGPFVVAQSLRGSPMKPKETRKLMMLDPTLGQIVQVTLQAKEYIKTPLLDGLQHNLLEINSVVKFGDRGLSSTLWVSKEGETMKTYTDALDIRSFRAEKIFAESVRDAVSCEALTKTKITLVAPINDFETTKNLIFKIRHPDIDPKRLLPGRTNQSVKTLTIFSAYVNVFAMNEKSPPPEGVTPELIVDPLCTKLSPIIQSDDPIVKKLASQFFEDKSLGETALERLRRGVFNLIKTKTPYSPLMSTAAEVARSQSGDCIDHAMLLAAVVRARGVPARVAIGLVFNGFREEPAMVLHSWTEVYLKDHWVCIDASVDASSTNASYLKLVDTPFADQNPYAPLLATLQAIELIELVVLD